MWLNWLGQLASSKNYSVPRLFYNENNKPKSNFIIEEIGPKGNDYDLRIEINLWKGESINEIPRKNVSLNPVYRILPCWTYKNSSASDPYEELHKCRINSQI